MARPKDREQQGMLEFPQRGGARPGAGRKPNGPRALVSHDTRPDLAPRFPVHVSTRLIEGLPSLRADAERAALERTLHAGSDRFGFRLVEYSIQTNHLHLVAEATDRTALSRGMQGLKVRIARALNRVWNRKGRVFADRYFARILRTPREVRNGLAYVLHNARKHGIPVRGVVPYSSGAWFDGWKERGPPLRGSREPVGVQARTWLLNVGWKWHGRISIHETPAARAA
jgi:REP element-mobilizing transposase RayT